MVNSIDYLDSAIARGIKTIGVGKRGARSLSPDLVTEIVADLCAGKVSDVAKGAFFAALIYKGLAEQEKALHQAFEQDVLGDNRALVNALASDAPDRARALCVKLLEQKTLNREQALELGRFLFADQPGDGARGIAASILRVRYETPDEYEGLLQAMEETKVIPCKEEKEPLADIQLAEPFDGVDHSYMVTPLLGKLFRDMDYRVVHCVGRNSGPKNVMNLLDIAQALNEDLLKSKAQLIENKAPYGWFLSQQDVSPAIDHWVDLRRQTIKRPFLSTLERFLNPLKARYLAVSAFHPPYAQKMVTIAERAGYEGIIVVLYGVEGTLAFPLKKRARIFCSAKQGDGTFLREEIVFDPVAVELEERVEDPTPEDNARLIVQYAREGKTDNEVFDLRVKRTCEGFRQAIGWLEGKVGRKK